VVAVHIVVGSLAIALNAAALIWGTTCWHRRMPSQLFWRLLRAGQGFVVLEAVLGGIWIATGAKVSELHVIYGLLPIFVAFMAEQLRVSAAQMTLDKRGFLTPKDVGKLSKDEQQEIVVAIVRREIGVMTLSVLVTLVLVARAAMVH
jgi:hypothetical protein